MDLDISELPADTRYIGEETRIIQNIKLTRENIKFIFKRYYSPSEHKTYIGEIEGYDGSKFGSDLKAFIDYLYYKLRVPHEKIREFLLEFEIDVSKGSLEKLLNERREEFREELLGAGDASVQKYKSHHLDETGHKLNNHPLYTFCFSNEAVTLLSSYSRKRKSEAMRALFGGRGVYCMNEAAMSLLKKQRRSLWTKMKQNYLFNQYNYDLEGFKQVLREYEFTHQEETQLKFCALYGGYIAGKLGPPLKYLVTDDAKNLKLWKRHQLCWVHEIRKYKLLDLYEHSDILKMVVKRWFKFYKLLKLYKRNPTKKNKSIIWRTFNKLCHQHTGLQSVKEQLLSTYKNRKRLLYVLNHPDVEIHNNLVERDIREKVIKKKISLFNRSMKGVKAWDLMLSLASTCTKNNISFWRYLTDRIHKRDSIPYLGKIIAST